MFSWFLERGLKQGVFWAVMIYVVSSLNDVLMKILGDRLHFVEISFFRFLFSVMTISIPVIFSKNNLLKTNIHGMHIMRGIVGAIALGMCCFGVNVMPLAENTTILFSEAFFILPMAVIYLKEKVSLKSWIATIIGFIGLLIMFRPSIHNFNYMAIIPTIAAFLFATMSIMIKYMVNKKENNLTMLFYFGLYTTIISGIFVPFFWVSPNIHELFLILLLGIGANLIQLFIFLAYRAADASAISPIRYTELPFAILFGFLFFGQIPDIISIVGASLIIFGSFLTSSD